MGKYFFLILLSFGLMLNGQVTIRVSVSSDGSEGNDRSDAPVISANNRFITFHSLASNLIQGDTNHYYDVFVYDIQTGETTRISVSSDGEQGNGHSLNPSISGDGRYVAFESSANNLVLGDWTGYDVFVHDRQTQETTLVGINSDGTPGNYGSEQPSISEDGRYVVFLSYSYNLVTDDTNSLTDVFVHDRINKETTRVSVDSGGSEGDGSCLYASQSPDGRYVVFESNSHNLVPDVSGGIFIHDRVTGITSSVDVGEGLRQGDTGCPRISGDGRYLSFVIHRLWLEGYNLVPYHKAYYYFHNRETGVSTFLAQKSAVREWGLYEGPYPSLSSDGRYVEFVSSVGSLVPDDTNNNSDVFIWDRLLGNTSRVSVSSEGTEGNGACSFSSLSPDGRYVVFSSDSDNLVPNDTNYSSDIFLRGKYIMTLDFSVSKRTERAWLIQRDYAEITLNVEKKGNVLVEKYIIYRKESDGEFQNRAEILDTELHQGSYFYQDTYIDSNTTFSYKIHAVDLDGNILATTEEKSI
jgi:Tol biopolymer transport system component